MDSIQIQCPKCKWEPDGQPYWQCTCGVSWDTFATGARCPSCGKGLGRYTMRTDTQVVASKWSPHLDWYGWIGGVGNKTEGRDKGKLAGALLKNLP